MDLPENAKIVGVGMIIKTTEGDYVFHERDEYAEVAPNKVGFFAGGLEEGESIEKAVSREAQEELEIEAGEEAFVFVDYVAHLYDPSHLSAIFFIDNIDFDKLNLHEGRSIKKFDSLESFLNHSEKTKLAEKFIYENLEKIKSY